MLLDIVKKDSTNRSVMVRVIDSSDGTPETGVAYNTAGVDLWYRREGAAHTSITEATQTEGGAHSDGGFVHISDGYCRLDLPDAAFATGANYVDVGGTFTGMVVIGGRVRLVDFDLEDSVRGGLTALPNAAADAAGGLIISDAGGLDADAQAASVTAIEADTNELQTDDIPGLIAALNDPTAAAIADAVWDEPLEDHDTQGNAGWAQALAVYEGPEGPGIYCDSTASNTNTVVGTDGTAINPVSTLTAARTIADALGLKRYYIDGGSSFTLSATHQDWHIVGLTGPGDNTINLGAAASATDVDRTLMERLRVIGTQGGSDRLVLIDCQVDDAPAAEVTTLNPLLIRCELAGDFEINATSNNVFESCWSGVAGNGTPKLTFNGASGAVSIRHYSGGIEIASIGASQTLSLETDGQVVFASDCNVNANVTLRGLMTITDNTVGMANLTQGAVVNMSKINTEADTAISDAALATAAALATVDSNVDAILVDTGTTIPATLGTPAGADMSADIAAVKVDTAATLVDTAEIGAAGAGLTAVPWNASWDAEVQSEATDALNAFDFPAAILDNQIADSVPADGTLPTIEQALYMITQFLYERAVSGTTVTVKKADGSTSLLTLTLDDGTNPTSISRAT